MELKSLGFAWGHGPGFWRFLRTNLTLSNYTKDFLRQSRGWVGVLRTPPHAVGSTRLNYPCTRSPLAISAADVDAVVDN